MVVVTVKRVDAIFDQLRQELPRAVESDGDFEDWNVVAPALIAVAADLLEGILASPPPRGRVRAEIFARSLAEYAIAFAWLAGADDEERARRLKALLKDEYREREKVANKLSDHIGRRDDYRDLFDPEKRKGGPLPAQLLDEPTRERLEALKADDSIPGLPDTFSMAFAADERWMPEIDLVEHNRFALIYVTLFSGPSFMTHASVSSVGRVVVGTPPNLIVGTPEALGDSETPYAQAYLTMFNMLLVASRALGWPDEAILRAGIVRDAAPVD
jgi:hypothetical protein